MIKNSLMRFIDSCVGNIARKIEDEFRESDHPRDKGGKFTSKGGEGRGGGKEKSTKLPWDGDEEETSKLAKKYGISYRLTEGPGEDPHQHIELTGDPAKVKQFIINEGFGGDEKEAKKWVPETFNGSGSSSVTGPEDRDYMNEEDDEQTSAKTPNRQAVEELIDTAAEGFYQNLDVVPKFVKQMGYKYSRGEKSYYEQYPRELVDVALDLIEKDPYKAHEVLGPWVDHIDLDEEDEYDDDEQVKWEHEQEEERMQREEAEKDRARRTEWDR